MTDDVMVYDLTVVDLVTLLLTVFGVVFSAIAAGYLLIVGATMLYELAVGWLRRRRAEKSAPVVTGDETCERLVWHVTGPRFIEVVPPRPCGRAATRRIRMFDSDRRVFLPPRYYCDEHGWREWLETLVVDDHAVMDSVG